MKNMQKNISTYLLIVGLLCFSASLITGCASRIDIPARQKKLAQQFPSSWNESITTIGTAAHLEELTTNPELKKLILEALKENPNLLATAYKLKASGLLLSVSSSAYLPSLSLEGSGTRSNATGKEADSYSTAAKIQWEIDLWGKLADLYEADKLGVAAKAEDYIAARNALIARVITAWVELSSQYQAVSIQHKRVTALQNTQDIVLDRYNIGLGKSEDLATAKANTEAARQVLLENMLVLSKKRRTLELLTGKYPSGRIHGETTLPIIQTPVVAVPLSVLTGRPDIKAAWLRVQQADTTVSAANKAFLPSINLTADLGYSSNGFTAIGTGPSVWNAISTISQPVFQGGKLVDTAKARSEESKAAWEEYRETVLKAAQEVENALENEQSLTSQEHYLLSSLKYATESRINYEQQYNEGLTDILNLLTAKNNELNTEAQLLAIRTSRLTNRISLALAAGLNSVQESAEKSASSVRHNIKEPAHAQ